MVWGTSDDSVCGTANGLVGNFSGGSGHSACIDSDAAPVGRTEAYLCSSAFDMNGVSNGSLQFNVNYQIFGIADADDRFEVLVGTSPPSSTSVSEYTTVYSSSDASQGTLFSSPGVTATVDLAAFSAEPELYICFAYGGLFDWSAQIDDVAIIADSCAVNDSDLDGFLNANDNCTLIYNPLQIDSNGDGIGNQCDADVAGSLGADDDDCVVNALDLSVFAAAFLTTPSDTNWNPNVDFTGPDNQPDGVINAFDWVVMRALILGLQVPVLGSVNNVYANILKLCAKYCSMCAIQGAQVVLPALCLALLVVTKPALSFPVIYQQWSETYPAATIDEQLIAANGAPCQLCHVNPGGGEPWNQYGYSILINGGFLSVPQVFNDIETFDADGEGNDNITEIVANSLPGWCNPSTPGCENLAWTRSGISSPATPPQGAHLDPPMVVAPIASAGGPYVGTPGIRLRFDASQSSDADGQIVRYDWKFGDGATARGVQPVHVYALEGRYTVYVKVYDNDNNSSLASATVIIAPDLIEQSPVADAGGPYSGVESMSFMLDGSASFDLDGQITTWNWDFGDGVSGSGEIISHSYLSPGEYPVTLTVTDNQGLSDSDSTTAAITEALGPGEAIFRGVCQACHGDPWSGPAIDPSLVAGRRNTGARTCSIQGAINGTLVFPGGVPQMQFLQGAFTTNEIQAVSDFLNSMPPQTGQQRFVTACAGCHGNDASGGPVNEDVRGRDAERIFDALDEETGDGVFVLFA